MIVKLYTVFDTLIMGRLHNRYKYADKDITKPFWIHMVMIVPYLMMMLIENSTQHRH